MGSPKKARGAKVPELQFPRLDHTSWTILGLDLSLSRTGFATLHCDDGEASWGDIGSLSPRDSKQETWLRSAALGIIIREKLEALQRNRPHAAVILAVEYPDPKNSYLMGLNQVIQTILWTADDLGGPAGHPQPVYRLAINASTLRAALRIGAASTKDDNLNLAYHYVPKATYPQLDSDSCDAVLLSMMGRYATMVFAGQEDLVPLKPRCALCSCVLKQKFRTSKLTGEKTVAKETPTGILHNPLTWTRVVAPHAVTLGIANAASKSRAIATTIHV